jgi:hypothetical protein
VLGQEYWVEVVDIACYLVNQSPSLMLVDKTPHEAWIGKNPSLKHIKVFGCDVYAHIPKKNISKLDNKDENVSLLVVKMV